MKISVIIPTYKPQNYLWDCLASLVAQTFPKGDFEVILVLNGCNEPYKSAIERYIAEMMQGMHVNLIHAENPGVSNARNIGLDNAKGEYVAFVDDDDIVSTIYLEGLYNVSSRYCIGCANSFSFKSSINEKLRNRLSSTFENVRNCTFSLVNFRQFLSPPVLKLIHKDIIGSVRFNTTMKISEDALFCATISKNIMDMRCASEDVIYYIRQRQGSATRKKFSVFFLFMLTLKKIFLFWKIYFSDPLHYNFCFFFSRTLACLKHLEVLLKNSYTKH